MNPIPEFVLTALFRTGLQAIINKLMPREKEPKKSNFSLRMDDDLRAKLEAAATTTGEEDTSVIVRACIRAYVEAVERDGEITKPYALVGKKKLAALESQALHAPRESGPVAKAHQEPAIPIHSLSDPTPDKITELPPPNPGSSISYSPHPKKKHRKKA